MYIYVPKSSFALIFLILKMSADKRKSTKIEEKKDDTIEDRKSTNEANKSDEDPIDPSFQFVKQLHDNRNDVSKT